MIIGLVGFIGSGKGTVGDFLESDYGFVKESFAKAVKDAVATIFCWDRGMLEGDTVQSRAWREQPDAYWSAKMGKEFTPRQALQLMGTEAGRNVFHPDLWVYAMERRINPNKNYVITDARFGNELKMIRNLGGKVIRVCRGTEPEWYNEALRTVRISPGAQKMHNYPGIHYSEWAWVDEEFDAILTNNLTVNDLKQDVHTYLTSIGKFSII